MRFLVVLAFLGSFSLSAQFSLGLNIPMLSAHPDYQALTWYPGLNIEVGGLFFNGYADGRMNIGWLSAWQDGQLQPASKDGLLYGLALGVTNLEFMLGANREGLRYLGFINFNWRTRQTYFRDSMPHPLIGVKLQFRLVQIMAQKEAKAERKTRRN